MDELAEKLGMDPFDLRYKNVYRKGSTTPNGQDPEVYSLPEMMDKLKPKYEAAKKRAAAESTADVKRGVGISVAVYGAGLDGPDSSQVDVGLNPDGTVTIYTCWEDHGQGADAGSLGTAHEALLPLNITPQQIKLVMNDTSLAPNAGPAGGSRSQVMAGNATRVGCEMLVAAMKKPDGTFRTYDEMVAEGKPLRYEGKWTAPAKDCDENGQGSPFSCYMYGVFMAEVAVEVASGKTTVEKMTMVADVGKVNNFLVVDGQIYGGMAQAIGLALYEDYEDIKKHSTMVGAGFPYIKQIPDDMEIIYVESPRPAGPFGASGVGEIPLCGPHPAIINAIYNACGARIRQLPAYPEKVLAALKANA
jgi:aldehyde oxidoreductase